MSIQTKSKFEHTEIVFCGQSLILDAQGCLYYPEEKTLVFSDLHFEKGSYLVSQGNPLPLYDTLDTLLRVERCIQKYTPETVISLGDSLHDLHALERMHPHDQKFIEKMCSSVQNWHWIIGNHDKHVETLPLFNQFKLSHYVKFQHFQFLHDYENSDVPQIIGHFHPKASINIGGQVIRGKCFLATQNLIVMPAFGTYTGGLDIHSEAIEKLLNKQSYGCYLLKRGKIWQIK